MDFAELKRLYNQPLFDLITQSRAHLHIKQGEQVQRCSLLSIKTGGCSEIAPQHKARITPPGSSARI